MNRGAAWRTLLFVLCLAPIGCLHKNTQVTVPTVPHAPAPLEKAPESNSPAVLQTVPLQPAPLPALTMPVKKVKKPRKKAIVVAPIAPPQTIATTEAPPEDNVIGALTAGGEAAPEKYQKAEALIAELEKRIAALAPATAEQEKPAIARVRYFEDEAQKALKSGDADGAVILATKAKLLLDDLEK